MQCRSHTTEVSQSYDTTTTDHSQVLSVRQHSYKLLVKPVPFVLVLVLPRYVACRMGHSINDNGGVVIRVRARQLLSLVIVFALLLLKEAVFQLKHPQRPLVLYCRGLLHHVLPKARDRVNKSANVRLHYFLLQEAGAR